MIDHTNPIAKRLMDDDMVTINTLKQGATLINEYEDALRRIVQAKTVEEAALIAMTALM
jgi:hypothetical protein